MNRTKLALFAAALLAVSTPAAAVWSSHGDQEPNTVFDTEEYMRQAPPAAGESLNLVYFNAYASNSLLLDTNANSAVLGSRVSPTPLLFWEAIFGVWKDCNGDGYIGMVESAVGDYRSETLVDSSECPSGQSMHNDGEWVRELIAIGRVDPCEYEPEAVRNDPDHVCNGATEFYPHAGVIYSNATLMWGDQGAPGEALGGSSCPIRPAPRGTTGNTGLMLRYADCFVAWRIADTLNENDPTGGSLTFGDRTNPQNSHDNLLVQNTPVSLFGNPEDGNRVGLLEQDSSEPTARVWDCSGSEPTASPGVASDPTSSSVFDTADGAADGLTFLDAPIQDAVVRVNTEVMPTYRELVDDQQDDIVVEHIDCNDGTRSVLGTTYFGQNLYGQDPSFAGLIEGPNTPSNTNGKDANDFTFTFFDSGFNRGVEPDKTIMPIIGNGAPQDLGINSLAGSLEHVWTADVLYLSTPQSVNRATLQASGRGYWSHYAYIDPAELSALNIETPSPGVRTYGAENCGGANTGVVNGWNCDRDVWYPLVSGQSSRPAYQDGSERGALPGDDYQFRDVDCFDGTIVRGVPVRASGVDASGDGPCADEIPGGVRQLIRSTVYGE